VVTIVFETHSTTVENEKHVASGQYDVRLSELGKKQARELGERYKHDCFDAVFVSDLKRSCNTAEIAFADRDVKIIKDKRLRECDYGDFEGCADDKVRSLRTNFLERPFPHGESYRQCTERMRSFLKDLVENYDEMKVLIIGHRATQFGLEHWINRKDLKEVVAAPWQWQAGWIYSLGRI
jgi:2,3-bisphosphoglycerate-dependent phosphoglycerate mutase